MLKILKTDNSALRIFSAFTLIATIVACDGGSPGPAGNSIEEANAESIPDIGAAIDGTNGNFAQSTNQHSAIEQGLNNQAPEIISISLGCDLVLDSISIGVNESASFTLAITDEIPATVTYSVSTDDSKLLNVVVDENGNFTMNAIAAGITTVPIQVTDEAGNSDDVLLRVVVES